MRMGVWSWPYESCSQSVRPSTSSPIAIDELPVLPTTSSDPGLPEILGRYIVYLNLQNLHPELLSHLQKQNDWNTYHYTKLKLNAINRHVIQSSTWVIIGGLTNEIAGFVTTESCSKSKHGPQIWERFTNPDCMHLRGPSRALVGDQCKWTMN